MLVHIDNVKYKCKPSKMEISVQELDKEGFKLNTPDGIVDLRTRKIYPHDPKDYCTKMTAVSPSLEGMDEWRDFLDRLTYGDKSLQDYLQICSGIIRCLRIRKT